MKCDGNDIIPAIYLALYAGLAIGGITIGPLIDIYGKKSIFLTLLLCIIITYCLILFEPVGNNSSYLVFYIFVYAFVLSPIIISGLLLTLQ